MELFSMDNPFFRFVGRVVDLVWINILTLICCLPAFTAGAAFTAMYKVLLGISLNREGAITKGYFKAFKENFKSATLVWIPALILILILGGNGYLLRTGKVEMDSTFRIVVSVSIALFLALIDAVLNYYFAMISRYDAPAKTTFKNAILMMVAYLPRSLCIIVISILPIALMTLTDYFLWFWWLYGFSIPGYFIAMLLGNIFIKTEEETDAR